MVGVGVSLFLILLGIVFFWVWFDLLLVVIGIRVFLCGVIGFVLMVIECGLSVGCLFGGVGV